MTNKHFKIHRVTSLPGTLEAYAVYLVAPSNKPDYVEMYVVDSTGSKARRIIGEDDVKTLIQNGIAEQVKPITEAKVLDTYSQLNATLSEESVVFAYVKDASGDSTVTRGGALYIKSDSSWVKISETESLDLVLDWTNIQSKPAVLSRESELEDAITKAHTHTNKDVLDGLTDSSGSLLYKGNAITTTWATADW